MPAVPRPPVTANSASSPGVRVRAFLRSDRDQLTTLVNAHLGAVAPGSSVSVQALLSSLERDPGEFIVDPWVVERRTLVAEQRNRLVAAAHLVRYGSGPEVGEHYRDTAEIRWLVCWPEAPFWPDSPAAGTALMSACLAQLDAWPLRTSYADGSLPGPGVYGVPEQWPHICSLYESAGFSGGRYERVLIATTERLLRESAAALDLRLTRVLGVNGTRFRAHPEGESTDVVVGYLEVDINLGEAGRFSPGAGWADIGNLFVSESHRRSGVATWLLGHAAHWLELGGVGRLLTYLSTDPEADAEAAFCAAVGFELLTTTRRMLERVPPRA